MASAISKKVLARYQDEISLVLSDWLAEEYELFHAAREGNGFTNGKHNTFSTNSH